MRHFKPDCQWLEARIAGVGDSSTTAPAGTGSNTGSSSTRDITTCREGLGAIAALVALSPSSESETFATGRIRKPDGLGVFRWREFSRCVDDLRKIRDVSTEGYRRRYYSIENERLCQRDPANGSIQERLSARILGKRRRVAVVSQPRPQPTSSSRCSSSSRGCNSELPA